MMPNDSDHNTVTVTAASGRARKPGRPGRSRCCCVPAPELRRRAAAARRQAHCPGKAGRLPAFLCRRRYAYIIQSSRPTGPRRRRAARRSRVRRGPAATRQPRKRRSVPRRQCITIRLRRLDSTRQSRPGQPGRARRPGLPLRRRFWICQAEPSDRRDSESPPGVPVTVTVPGPRHHAPDPTRGRRRAITCITCHYMPSKMLMRARHKN